jgi:hypothetical protein
MLNVSGILCYRQNITRNVLGKYLLVQCTFNKEYAFVN